MDLTKKISSHNFKSFLWHATFLAFAKNFMDVDTIIPSMIVKAGGGAIHIGILTAIMMGGSSFTQLFFAPYLSNKAYKKKYLLIGINTRVFALTGLGLLLFLLQGDQHNYVLWLLFLFITAFSLAGAYTNVSYVDILGKTISQHKRKTFFSANQIISGINTLGSAFLVKKILEWKEYPVNYAFMFVIGAILLLIATAGFWSIKETIPSGLRISGIKSFIRFLKTELKQNKKLSYFLGYINTQGIAISFLPFIILFANETFDNQRVSAGVFLVYKIIGVVFVSLLVLLGAKKLKYNLILYSNVLLSLLLVAMALFIKDVTLIKYIFVLGGIVFSLFTMSMNGLLLEVSGNENRAVYTGFAGAGNILPAIFPLIGGVIINQFGYQAFFILFMLIVATAAFFIFKINCKK
ncbi:MAG TPA: MFS transporter [Candidatus Uhrbacteria bacterium]|nr:MFS transporter [Candidatus Uhrbacteria bacterium]